MSGHTPGPWHVGEGPQAQIVYDKDGWGVANAVFFHRVWRFAEHENEMSEVKRYEVMFKGGANGIGAHGITEMVTASDYDTLAAQRDEGLAREAEIERENRLLRHDCASLLETMAKTCDLLGIDPESAQNAQGKPSDVLYEHAKDLQQRLAEAEKLLKVITSGVVHEAYNAVNDAKQFLASPGCADGEKVQ